MEVQCLMKRWLHNTTRQSNNRLLRNYRCNNCRTRCVKIVETWEAASVMYVPFEFSQVPVEERKFVSLLAKDLTKVDWSTQSVKNWVTKLQRLFNENFIVSRSGRIAVDFNACGKSMQDRPQTLARRVRMLCTPSLL